MISSLAPDSSYEDIMRELASRNTGTGNSTNSPAKAEEGQLGIRRVDATSWRRASRIGFLFVVVSSLGGLLQTTLMTPEYRAVALVRAEVEAARLMWLDSETFMKTEWSVLQSQALRRRVVGKLGLAGANADANAEARAIDELTHGLEITQAGHIFRISYASSKAATAERIANALAQEYVDQNLEQRRARINDQLKTISDYLADTTAQIQADQKNLIETTSEANVLHADVVSRNVATAQLAERGYHAQRNLQVEARKNGIPYQALRDRIRTAQTSARELQSQQKQLEILAKGMENNVRVIEPASIPQRPHKPDPVRILAIWIAVGAAAALLVIGLQAGKSYAGRQSG